MGGGMVARDRLRQQHVPDFATREEAAAYWGSHGLDDLEEELEEVDLEVAPNAGHVLSIRLEREAFRRLAALATERGENLLAVTESLVLEGLEREEAANRRGGGAGNG